MLIERQKKKLTAIRRMRKIANRPAKHRALQHSAHASLRAFFPLDLFVDRSVYLPRRPAVSLGFETGQRCPNSRRNDWNQIYLKERERKEKCRGRDKAGEQDLTRPTTRVTFVLSFFLFRNPSGLFDPFEERWSNLILLARNSLSEDFGT